jgi:hypothetical protein
MPLLAADSFAYQFYRSEKPQNDRSPDIVTCNLKKAKVEGKKCHSKNYNENKITHHVPSGQMIYITLMYIQRNK